MKPRRTHTSNYVYQLAGGTEDNDLWTRVDPEAGTVSSVWELTPAERQHVADGHNIQLTVWGGQPPVALHITDTPLGKARGKTPT